MISDKEFLNFKRIKINTSDSRRKRYFYKLYTNFRLHFFPNFQFSKFLGVKDLTDSSICGARVERYYGPVEKIFNFMDKLFYGNKVKKINTEIPKDIKIKIKERFSLSNKKIDSEFKLNLKKYNYF